MHAFICIIQAFLLYLKTFPFLFFLFITYYRSFSLSSITRAADPLEKNSSFYNFSVRFRFNHIVQHFRHYSFSSISYLHILKIVNIACPDKHEANHKADAKVIDTNIIMNNE